MSKFMKTLMGNLRALAFDGLRMPHQAPSNVQQMQPKSPRFVQLETDLPSASNVLPFPSVANIKREQLQIVEIALGADMLAELGQKTGLSRMEVVSRLIVALPDVFNCYPPIERPLTISEARTIERLKLIFTRAPCETPTRAIEHSFHLVLRDVCLEEPTTSIGLPRLRA